MAGGTFGGGAGTSASPWLVEDSADLIAIGTKPILSCYKQTKDIDLIGIANWSPLFPSTSTNLLFQGIYDGNGYKIINLKTTGNANGTGLFSNGGYATFKNIALINCDILGTDYVGGICGQSGFYPSTYENCYVTGKIVGRNYVGGIAGFQINGGAAVAIKNCYVSASVTGFAATGGIVGEDRTNQTITGCFALNEYIGRSSGSANTYFGSIAGSGHTGAGNYTLDTLEFRQL